jgi:hypothetical protein
MSAVRECLTDLKEETMQERKITQVCRCENCGNEAEMTITCSIAHEESSPATLTAEPKSLDAESKGKIRGHAVCSSCGGEADMWLDL